MVLDTGVVVSALVFAKGPTARLRLEWQAADFVPLASRDTIGELMRVLEYPKFRLSDIEREELLGDYLPWTEAVAIPNPAPRVPPCRDPADAMFLHLAQAGRASHLVTGDSDLLVLAPHTRFSIVTPAEFLARLPER
ncbi:MAG TPA: putative toxin-antitoxin system toxin component, PIN family [Ramlibacter sp.]|uniref:putative toxin-antitoxin system toxin component, PIN family n=1 Tax=Ramlibacter sp. TaxID=1917967 RepID=UPI002CA03B92|nr:putative toxin-antitoxin system toxin component, PIN family [Ramlibacter sp.]HVZ42620.1 putative toxin-antitoxin system toxin component, PIN family [Ramlibacter sp.]